MSVTAVLTIQSLIFFLALFCLLFLVVNAVVTGSIWVRGSRTGFINFKQLAHKRSRRDYPNYYWGFLAFYATAVIGLLYLRFF